MGGIGRGENRRRRGEVSAGKGRRLQRRALSEKWVRWRQGCVVGWISAKTKLVEKNARARIVRYRQALRSRRAAFLKSFASSCAWRVRRYDRSLHVLFTLNMKKHVFSETWTLPLHQKKKNFGWEALSGNVHGLNLFLKIKGVETNLSGVTKCSSCLQS